MNLQLDIYCDVNPFTCYISCFVCYKCLANFDWILCCQAQCVNKTGNLLKQVYYLEKNARFVLHSTLFYVYRYEKATANFQIRAKILNVICVNVQFSLENEKKITTTTEIKFILISSKQLAMWWEKLYM